MRVALLFQSVFARLFSPPLYRLFVCNRWHFTKQINRSFFRQIEIYLQSSTEKWASLKRLEHIKVDLSKTWNYWLEKWPNFPIENLLLTWTESDAHPMHYVFLCGSTGRWKWKGPKLGRTNIWNSNYQIIIPKSFPSFPFQRPIHNVSNEWAHSSMINGNRLWVLFHLWS